MWLLTVGGIVSSLSDNDDVYVDLDQNSAHI